MSPGKSCPVHKDILRTRRAGTIARPAGKGKSAAGTAVRVTEIPVAKDAWHVAPQSTPAGMLVTVPLPALPAVRVPTDPDCPARTGQTVRSEDFGAWSLWPGPRSTTRLPTGCFCTCWR
jgi:hypothetical protein